MNINGTSYDCSNYLDEIETLLENDNSLSELDYQLLHIECVEISENILQITVYLTFITTFDNSDSLTYSRIDYFRQEKTVTMGH